MPTEPITYGVITAVAEPPNSGNMATAIDVHVVIEKGPINEKVVPLMSVNPNAALTLRVPVFTAGEILILGEDGREVAPPGRKPDKWQVQYEEFDDVHEAIARAREVSD